MPRALLPLAVLVACSPALPELADGGLTHPVVCLVPVDGGVFASGLPATVPGCALTPRDAGLHDLGELGPSLRGGSFFVPDSSPGSPLPVVFAFHGAGATGASARALFDLEAAADGGAIFVYPDAARGTWDIGPRSIDALRVDTAIRRLSETTCIDPDRIYIAGFSAGAVFTLYLGCNVPGRFRGMASVAGEDLGRFDTRCCTGSISGIFIHGTADDTIRLSAGQLARSRTLGRDACQFSPLPDDENCQSYACPAPYAVEACEWPGGHAVPPWAGEEIWRFFSAGGS